MYHNTEDLRGEPHAVAIRGEDDVHVTEEVFKRPLFLQPSYRYWPGLRGGPSVLGVGARWACSPGAASVSPSAVGLSPPCLCLPREWWISGVWGVWLT